MTSIYFTGPVDALVSRTYRSSPSSITNCVPPNLLTGTAVSDWFCVGPKVILLDPSLQSRGPGVEIPNTELGVCLRDVDVITPLTSSSSVPCSKNLSAIG